MSALPPIADIAERRRDVRFVPKADICTAAKIDLFDHLVGCGERDCGMVRPRVFAVLRLITNSYLVGACTGISAGFSPLRMRSIYPAACRTTSCGLGPYEIRPPST